MLVDIMENTVYNTLMSAISKWERGRIFYLEDFSYLNDPVNVRYYLCKLVEEGFIVRLARGIYCYPKVEGEYSMHLVKPHPDTIAHALAARENVRIIPYGDQAANELGLCSMVISNHKYITDGSPRVINLSAGKKIYFNHTSEVKMFAFCNSIMQKLSSAIRALGKEYFEDEEIIRRVREVLKDVPTAEYEKDINLPPAWVGKIINDIWMS